jgi:hypothetical protein
MADSNLDRLLEAGVIRTKDLSKPEIEVIGGLSEEEMKTLIGIRKRLGAAAGEDSPAAGLGDSTPLASNVII